jgi:uncharacterized protein with GYD domain
MLFCITANYTPKALEAMGKNPNTNRREAVEKLVTAAGGKLVAMYGTIAEGPGAMVIFEVDPAAAPAIAGVAASSDGVTNVKLQRLFSGDEVRAIRQKRTELQKSYRPPGQ